MAQIRYNTNPGKTVSTNSKDKKQDKPVSRTNCGQYSG